MDTNLNLNNTVITTDMKIDSVYTISEIRHFGLRQNQIENVNFMVFQNENKVFFFEPDGIESYRLYSIN